VTTFYLIRHAANDFLKRGAIAGWQPGVHLNEQGRREADRLAESLASAGITHLYSSPLERALQTTAPLAASLGLEVQTCDAIGEVQFGEWTGKSFGEIQADPRWRVWNESRSTARIPGGETMLEIQARFVGFMGRLSTELPEGTVALFSHGDPIRAALLYYLGMPLDFVHRIEVSPASVSILKLAESGARVVCINRPLP
jgi:probable phosphoglycerate mutase